MRAIFSRRVVVVCSSSLQRTNLLTKPRLPHPSQSRHFLSHVLLSGISSSSATSCFVPSLLSRSDKIRGFFASTSLGNNYLKQKFGNLLESRVGFFGFELPFESGSFTGFQKHGWKSWIKGGDGVVFGLILANAAVFTLWRVSESKWMIDNFVLSKFSFPSGRIHTLITSGFSNFGPTQCITNMLELYYFGTRITRTLGPVYLLKLYVAGTLGSSVIFLVNEAVMGILLESTNTGPEDQPYAALQGADGSVNAMILLDIFLYPKVTTYFGLMLRVPVMAGLIDVGNSLMKMLEGQTIDIVQGNAGLMGGIVVAAMAWARLRKRRLC